MNEELFYFLRKMPVELARYLPRFLSKDKTFKDLLDTLSWEHERYRLKIIHTAKQFFIETCDDALTDWEKFLGITPKPDQSFEERKKIARIKLRGAATMTVAETIRLMHEFITSGTAGVKELSDFEIEIVLDNVVGDFQQMFQNLFEYLPAHLGFSIRFYCHSENEIYIGDAQNEIITADVDLAKPYAGIDEIFISAAQFDSSKDFISYDDSDYQRRRNELFCYGRILFATYEEISADSNDNDTSDRAEWERFLWLRYLRWGKDPLIQYYNPEHVYDDDFDDPADDVDPDDEETYPRGNFLRLYFKFPKTRRFRYITLRNPKDDLTGSDINTVGLKAAGMLMNSRGRSSNTICRALYITRHVEKIL